MIQKLQLQYSQKELVLTREKGFRSLILKSAFFQGRSLSDEMVSVQFVLTSDTHMFNAFANQIPGTTKLNCFDLLSVASSIPDLRDHKFHTLKCILCCDKDNDDLVIDLTISMGTNLD